MAKKYYSGIGSRNTPTKVLKKMAIYAKVLEQFGYILRSGGARGADKAFERGVSNKDNQEIFRSEDAAHWTFNYVAKHCMPKDRKGFYSWATHTKGLLARNMMQVLGVDGVRPVDFVVCWTSKGDYNTSEVGGTGYAVRCALKNDIPVYNLGYDAQMEAFEEFLKSLFREKEISI